MENQTDLDGHKTPATATDSEMVDTTNGNNSLGADAVNIASTPAETTKVTLSYQVSINTTWAKNIPWINRISMILSILLLLLVDMAILFQSPDLAPFFVIMLVVLLFFGMFYYLENRIYSKKFNRISTALDKWLLGLIIVRNVAFFLNFIPYIQLLGIALLVIGGLPYLIVYFWLVSRRLRYI